LLLAGKSPLLLLVLALLLQVLKSVVLV